VRVTISVGGTFHAFQLAEQLDRRGALDRLLTTHRPLRGERIAPGRIAANPLPELFVQVPSRLRLPWGGDYAKAQLFDWWASRRVPRTTDLLVAFAAFALHTIRAVKPRGIPTVLERSSAHIAHQLELLTEEYARWKIPLPPADQRLVTKQLWEYGEADYISVPSAFARRSFTARGVAPDRLLQIPLGVDLEVFRPRPRTDRTFRIMAGGLSLRKGLPYLLEAAGELPGDVEVVFTGRLPGEVRELVRRLVARSRVRIRDCGPLPRGRLAELYAACSVLVLPSIEDGFGLVILEAMASGIPVICSEHTAGPDIVREGVDGFVVPIRDSQALRDRLRDLCDHPGEQARMGEAARARAAEFSYEAYGARVLAEYARLARQPRPAPAQTSPAEFYQYFWRISDVWDDCGHWTAQQFRRHFDGWLAPDDVVLDVGCGDARAYQPQMRAVVRAVHGVDISPDAVARARARGVDAVVHDLSRPLPYPDAMFTKVVCFEVLEHLFDPKFAVQEMARVLRPGGLLIASVPNAGYFRDRLRVLLHGHVDAGVTDFANPWKAPHIRFFNRAHLVGLLEACGLRVVAVRSKSDPSIFDALAALGGPGRFVARQLSERLPRWLTLGFLGDRWPGLFAPSLLVVGVRGDAATSEVRPAAVPSRR